MFFLNLVEEFVSEQNTGPAAPENNPEQKTELQTALEQVEKFKNDYLYLRAEFENYRKHVIKERTDLLKYSSEILVRELLPVLDNFERALLTELNPENLKTFRQGVEMTAASLKTALNKVAVSEVAAEGAPFDPNVHEALTSEPSESVPDGHVLRVFQKAYKMHDKLLRPAQVVVARKP